MSFVRRPERQDRNTRILTCLTMGDLSGDGSLSINAFLPTVLHS
jgi:hypothetical protein